MFLTIAVMIIRKKKIMIKQLFHKLPIRIAFANLDNIGYTVHTPKFTLFIFRKPRFLRRKGV